MGERILILVLLSMCWNTFKKSVTFFVAPLPSNMTCILRMYVKRQLQANLVAVGVMPQVSHGLLQFPAGSTFVCKSPGGANSFSTLHPLPPRIFQNFLEEWGGAGEGQDRSRIGISSQQTKNFFYLFLLFPTLSPELLKGVLSQCLFGARMQIFSYKTTENHHLVLGLHSQSLFALSITTISARVFVTQS